MPQRRRERRAARRERQGGAGGRALPVAGFTGVLVVFVLVMLGATLPTPLYHLWERQYDFSPSVTTVVFATYAIGVLVALLLLGGVSDQVGRRPALAASIVLSLGSSTMFVLAGGLAVLFAARFVSGLAAGVATGAATAALSDLAGGGRVALGAASAGAASTFGLGVGPVAAGVLAQYSPGPTTLPFEVHLALCLVAAVALLPVPETVRRRGGEPLVRFRGVGVPARGRRTFTGAAVASFLNFALVGMFTSVVPAFLGRSLHETNAAVVGATIFLLFATSVLAQVLAAALPGLHHREAVRAGLAVVLAALAVLVSGLRLPSYACFAAGTALAGVATGLVFYGSLATALQVAPEPQRGQVSSAYFTAAYAGLIVPIVGVGVAAQRFGDFRAVAVTAAVLAALAVAAVVWLRG